MSDSRLEKFIYAICSMDVSDLPVPLSRIEKLWNCLITGEIPDFEPLSRNEKYLMAMLDRYDISNLPAPMTRGEKLLYKIAMGETDLSDVPGYLSRYEELLKYLIENGGISGGDFEYVLYTLNQSLNTLYTTAEKPVKSAILMGNTDYKSIDWITNFHYQHGLKITNGKVEYIKRDVRCSTCVDINENRSFILKASSNIDISIVTADKNNNSINDYGWFVTTADETRFTVEDNCKFLYLNFRKKDLSAFTSESEVINSGLTVKEQNLVSVKMPVLTTTGKNLFNGELEYGDIDNITGETINHSARSRSKDFIKTIPSASYFMYSDFPSDSTSKGIYVYQYDSNKNYIGLFSDGANVLNKKFTVADNCHFIKIRTTSVSTLAFNIGVMSNGETYEPYKSNILTTPSDLELRGIDNIKDKLNCLTGELTQYIEEVVFDGSSDESIGMTNVDDTTLVRFNIANVAGVQNGSANKVLCSSLPYLYIHDLSGGSATVSQECISNHSTKANTINIVIKRSRLSSVNIAGFRAYLQSNPITIQYSIATPMVKTVDLTVVNQDNQPAKLGTFENVTHVLLESAGLIPEVAMEVATNLLEDTVFSLTSAFNTLYPTAAKPVVDGTLYGSTKYRDISTNKFYDSYEDAKNIWSKNKYKLWCEYDSGSTSELNGTVDSGGDIVTLDFITINHSTYKLTGNCTYKKIVFYDSRKQYISGNRTTTSTGDLVCTVPSNAMYMRFSFFPGNDNTGKCSIVDENDNPIDFREDLELVSCQAPGMTMVGKNLFDGVSYIDGYIFPSGGSSTTTVVKRDSNVTSILFNVDKNTDYILSTKTSFDRGWVAGSLEPIKIGSKVVVLNHDTVSNTIRFNSGEYTYIMIYLNNIKIDIEEIQVEKGTAATPYEPYKSNILSTPSDLELRKVGKVQDEMNVMTGEVVERVGEIVLDGSENWYGSSFTSTNHYCAYIKLPNSINEQSINVMCDSLPIRDILKASNDNAGCIINRNNSTGAKQGNLVVKIEKNKLTSEDTDGLKKYLQSNPITVQYQLSTPTIKTVNLSVVNQDGNETKLRTFDDTTHVLLNSEGLIPTAALTVRTKIPSGSSTSLLMDDILTKQEQLNTTVDEQSNNVDATMVATTEIYEETL